MAIVAIQAWASLPVNSKFTSGNLAYVVTKASSTGVNAEVEVEGLSTSAASISSLELLIPNSIVYDGTTYLVKSIKSSAFQGKTNITSVSIEYGTVGISSKAFYGCTNLTRVKLPSSLMALNTAAFGNCSKLNSVYFACLDPSKCTIISSNAFPSNPNMSLYMPKNVVNQSAYETMNAFSMFSTKQKQSGAYDFDSNGLYLVVTGSSSSMELTGDVVGGNVNKYTDRALRITTPKKTFGPYSVEIQKIASEAFKGETNLKEVYLKGCSSLKIIDERAFDGCTALTKVTLNDELQEVWRAFSETGLETLHFPANVRVIGGSFLAGSSSCKSITVDSQNRYYSAEKGILYNKDKTELWYCPEALENVVLTEDFFPSTLQRVLQSAFHGNKTIRNVYLPYGLKKIGNGAFQYSKITLCKIPSSVTELGDQIFMLAPDFERLIINIETPPTTISDYMFQGTKKHALLVPFESVTKYKEANYWKDFADISSGAYDLSLILGDYDNTSNSSKDTRFTVRSTKPETINGTAYAGRVSMVSKTLDTSGLFTVSDAVTYKGKNYAVTSIDGDAVWATKDFTMKLGANVDSIRDKAFNLQNHLTDIELNANLKLIGNYAFAGTSVKQMILPYGFRYLKSYAFSNSKVNRLLVPSSLGSITTAAIGNMKEAQEIILNLAWASGITWIMGSTPTTCKIYVPTGVEKQYRANLPTYGNNVMAGAFDFTYGNMASIIVSGYHMTVLSNKPVTKDGVTYDGTAKYVYHPAIATKTGFVPEKQETYAYYGNKKYLMTEIGDSCFFYASGITSVDLTRMRYLERIGKTAFSFSGITSVTIPATVTEIGEYAFHYASSLKDITFMHGRSSQVPTLGTNLYGFNDPAMACYVNIDQFLTLKSEIKKTGTGDARVCPWFSTGFDTQVLGFPVALDYEKAGIEAYAISGYNTATRKLTTSPIKQGAINAGVLCVNLTKDKMYKIPRATSGKTEGYLRPASTGPVYIYDKGGLYWYPAAKRFVKPTADTIVDACRSYLMLPSEDAALAPWSVDILSTDIYGDVDNNGVVDISDVNILIDIVLGKDSASKYNGRADVDGNGGVDISDVNKALNIVLGK